MMAAISVQPWLAGVFLCAAAGWGYFAHWWPSRGDWRDGYEAGCDDEAASWMGGLRDPGGPGAETEAYEAGSAMAAAVAARYPGVNRGPGPLPWRCENPHHGPGCTRAEHDAMQEIFPGPVPSAVGHYTGPGKPPTDAEIAAAKAAREEATAVLAPEALDAAADDEDDWEGYCTPHCPDDVCRSAGRCAWPPLAKPGKQTPAQRRRGKHKRRGDYAPHAQAAVSWPEDWPLPAADERLPLSCTEDTGQWLARLEDEGASWLTAGLAGLDWRSQWDREEAIA